MKNIFFSDVWKLTNCIALYTFRIGVVVDIAILPQTTRAARQVTMFQRLCLLFKCGDGSRRVVSLLPGDTVLLCCWITGSRWSQHNSSGLLRCLEGGHQLSEHLLALPYMPCPLMTASGEEEIRRKRAVVRISPGTLATETGSVILGQHQPITRICVANRSGDVFFSVLRTYGFRDVATWGHKTLLFIKERKGVHCDFTFVMSRQISAICMSLGVT